MELDLLAKLFETLKAPLGRSLRGLDLISDSREFFGVLSRELTDA